MDQLSVVEKIGANYILFELSGAVSSYTMAELQEKLYTYILDSNVVLDLAFVTSIDSSALGMLMAAYNDGAEYGNRLFFMNPSEKARYAFEKTGFMDMFHLIHSVTEVSDESK